MTRVLTWVPVLLALFSCGSDEPPCARVIKDVTLDSPLAKIKTASLMRAGTGFLLVGYENGQVRWGRLSEEGELRNETNFPLVTPTFGPYFAATKKTMPGDQLVVIVGEANVEGQYQLLAYVQNLGDSQTPVPVVLATFPSGVTRKSVRITAGVAESGNVGLVAWGFQGQGTSLSYLYIGMNGVPMAAPAPILQAPLPQGVEQWDCLKVIETGTGLGISIAYPELRLEGTLFSGADVFERFEFNETGIVSDAPMQLRTSIGGCRVVGGPAGSGYVMAWQNSSGIYMGRLYMHSPTSPDATVISNLVLASTQFAHPGVVPNPAWVAPAGNDVAIGLTREEGPMVVRYFYDGRPHGSTLFLRSTNGKTGPVAAWVGPSKTFVTYTDQVGFGPTAVLKRNFLQVETPDVL
jgi:hypothetical protein